MKKSELMPLLPGDRVEVSVYPGRQAKAVACGRCGVIFRVGSGTYRVVAERLVSGAKPAGWVCGECRRVLGHGRLGEKWFKAIWSVGAR